MREGGNRMPRVKYNKTRKDNIYWYIDSDGNKKYAYRYRYYDRNGKRREKTKTGFDSEKAAERALIKVKADILDGNDQYVEYDKLKVEQWMEMWLESKKNSIRPSTYILYEKHTRNHIIPCLGHYRLTKLTKMTVQIELVNKLIAQGYIKTTIKIICTVFLAAINAAVEEGILQKNNFKKLDISNARTNNKQNFYTKQELRHFLKIVKENDPYTRYTVFLTLAMTGIRTGELRGIKWKDIDFDKKTLRINKQRQGKKEGPPKTDNGYRDIPLNKELEKQLKKYRAWCIEKKFSMGKKLKEDDYVFITVREGEPIGQYYVKEALKCLRKKYDFKYITPHGFRHTFTSLLLAEKTPLKTVAELVGDTPATINSVYSHSFRSTEVEAIETFNDIISD